MVLPPAVLGCLCSSSSVWWTLKASYWWGSEIRSSRARGREWKEGPTRWPQCGSDTHTENHSQLFHLSVCEWYSSELNEWSSGTCPLIEIHRKLLIFSFIQLSHDHEICRDEFINSSQSPREVPKSRPPDTWTSCGFRVSVRTCPVGRLAGGAALWHA